MKGVFWNIRRLNKASRGKCLADVIKVNKLDFIGVQETKKEIISGEEGLNSIDRNSLGNICQLMVLLGVSLWGLKNLLLML
jgi:hypothetical protein